MRTEQWRLNAITHSNGNRRLLLVGAPLLVASTILLAPLLGGMLGSLRAIFLLWTLYLFGCWALALVGVPWNRLRAMYATAFNRRPLEFALTWLPPVALLAMVFVRASPHLTAQVIAAITAVALVNGVTEELLWRGAFVATFPNEFKLALLFPVTLFTAWHVALALVPGVSYEGGGVLALVGGAALMGVGWSWVVWRTRDLRSVTIAHIMTNVFAFSGLALSNWMEK